MNILLIEPDSLLGSIYKDALEQKGHRVKLSRDAQTAVHLADEQTPDVVVLELQLRAHSGIEFLYEFRSYPEWQHIPIVLHTLLPEDDLAMPRQLGTVQYVYKPSTTLAQLVRTVEGGTITV
jgi:two-component system, sensor histidine kinase and response regulator